MDYASKSMNLSLWPSIPMVLAGLGGKPKKSQIQWQLRKDAAGDTQTPVSLHVCWARGGFVLGTKTGRREGRCLKGWKLGTSLPGAIIF